MLRNLFASTVIVPWVVFTGCGGEDESGSASSGGSSGASSGGSGGASTGGSSGSSTGGSSGASTGGSSGASTGGSSGAPFGGSSGASTGGSSGASTGGSSGASTGGSSGASTGGSSGAPSGGSSGASTGGSSGASSGGSAGAGGTGGSAGGQGALCGSVTCGIGELCCFDNPPKCVPAAQQCVYGYGSTAACDGAEDCPPGELCMEVPGAFPAKTGCVAATDPYSSYCHGEADCAGSAFDVACCSVGVIFAGYQKCLMKSVCP